MDTPGYAHGVAVIGETAFVADGSDGGLQVIDVWDEDAVPVRRRECFGGWRVKSGFTLHPSFLFF